MMQRPVDSVRSLKSAEPRPGNIESYTNEATVRRKVRARLSEEAEKQSLPKSSVAEP
jgi:hypothetical protein